MQSNLRIVPEWIGELGDLQYLNLNDCGMSTLPERQVLHVLNV